MAAKPSLKLEKRSAREVDAKFENLLKRHLDYYQGWVEKKVKGGASKERSGSRSTEMAKTHSIANQKLGSIKGRDGTS